jgi:hypothetical protein
MARGRFKLAAPILRESELHQAVARVLRLEIAAPRYLSLQGACWFSIDVAGYVGAVPGLRTSRGIVAGVPDVLILFRGRAHWIELKAMDGLLSPAQAHGASALLGAGCHYGIARTVFEVLALLDEWNVPRQQRISAEAH